MNQQANKVVYTNSYHLLLFFLYSWLINLWLFLSEQYFECTKFHWKKGGNCRSSIFGRARTRREESAGHSWTPCQNQWWCSYRCCWSRGIHSTICQGCNFKKIMWIGIINFFFKEHRFECLIMCLSILVHLVVLWHRHEHSVNGCIFVSIDSII